MDKSSIVEFRMPDSWLRVDYGFWPITNLSTNQPIEDELFSALEYISEIDDVGIPLFKSTVRKYAKKTYFEFRAFIRQAKNFYYAAKKLDYRSSALLYYYCFLNLAKAYIIFSKGESLNTYVKHGLEYKPFYGDLSHQRLYAHPNGVFPLFYKTIFNQNIYKKTSLNVVNLLGYCNEIAFEYESAGFGQMKTCYCRIISLSNSKTENSWTLIGIYKFDRIKSYKRTLIPFNNYFEQVVPPTDLIYKIFDLTPFPGKQLAYFQSKKCYKWDSEKKIDIKSMEADFQNSVRDIFDPVLFNSTWDFNISTPLRLNYQSPFCNAMAIYALFFYFGSLVRYNPKYLEDLFSSKDAWLIERFIKSTPETFLKYLISAVRRRTLVYSSG